MVLWRKSLQMSVLLGSDAVVLLTSSVVQPSPPPLESDTFPLSLWVVTSSSTSCGVVLLSSPGGGADFSSILGGGAFSLSPF